MPLPLIPMLAAFALRSATMKEKKKQPVSKHNRKSGAKVKAYTRKSKHHAEDEEQTSLMAVLRTADGDTIRFHRHAQVHRFCRRVCVPDSAFVERRRTDDKPAILTVVNGASFSTGPISPGELVLISGTAMGPTEVIGMQFDDQGRVVTTLSEVQVLFDGLLAPLIFVSQKQVSAVVPFGLAGNATTQIQVVYQGAASDPFRKPLAPSAPGILTSNLSGKGQAAATNLDGSPNWPTSPVSPGSTFTFFLTGEGQTDPPGVDGDTAKATASVVLPISVRIAHTVIADRPVR